MQSVTPWQDEAQRMVTLETDGYAYTRVFMRSKLLPV